MSDTISKSDLLNLPPHLSAFLLPHMDKLKAATSIESIIESMRQEEKLFAGLLAGMSREEIYKQMNELRIKLCIQSELIWILTRKLGGRVELAAIDFPPVEWMLKESFDPERTVKVFEAR